MKMSPDYQIISVDQLCPTLRDPMNHSTPGLPFHHQLPEFTQTHVYPVSDAIQPSHLCHPLLLLPPIPRSFRVFSNESTLCMRWPMYWSFSFSIIPSKEIPGLISFRMDWLDLLAVQGTLQSLLQHHSSKASILQCSAFFTAQLSHTYMTTGKTIALIIWTFVSKVMSLFLNTLSRFIIAFLSLSKCLLISWLQSPSTVILEPSQFSSVQFSRSVMSDSLQPHEMQHARPPCPLPTPGVHPNPCSLSQWCHPAISSSAVPFSSCPQSFPASGSFPTSQLFISGVQSIGASASVLPMNMQGWFPLGPTDLISLLSKWQVCSSTTVWNHQFFSTAFFMVQLLHPDITTGKTKVLTIHRKNHSFVDVLIWSTSWEMLGWKKHKLDQDCREKYQ